MAHLATTWPIAGKEADVVTGLREGSEVAFDWLIERYQASVYSLVYRLLDDPNDAADTVQEVFLKVFRSVAQFKGECSLKTWVYRIAVHEASNQRRWWRRHRRREISLESSLGPDDSDRTVAETLTDEGCSPFDFVASGEMRAAVEQALDELPLPFRSAVLLRDVEELSYEEIAEVLQVRVGTVKSRLARGREALRPKLAKYLERGTMEQWNSGTVEQTANLSFRVPRSDAPRSEKRVCV